MTLIDLEPYFKLYSRLRRNGEDMTLHSELLEQEKEFTGKSIVLQGTIKELDPSKNEIILAYKPQENVPQGNTTLKLISNLYFVFAGSDNLAPLLENPGIEKDDLVKVTGTITALHRNSVIRVAITALSVTQKHAGSKKKKMR